MSKLELKEKELLLKEVHHRIKNNMNTIYNLLQMQMQALEENAARVVLQDAASRVRAMMLLYDRLILAENISGLSLRDYLAPLVEEIIRIFPNKAAVRVRTEIAEVQLGARQLSPIGLMVNELITNAMKYAFQGRESGEICLSVTQSAEQQVQIEFTDDGIGLPAEVSLDDPPGFGLRIVQILVQQMNGTIEVDRSQGTRYRICFVP